MQEHHVDLRLNTELQEVIGDGDGSVTAIKTTDGEVIECQFVGLTVGVKPNIDLLEALPIKTNRGILVDEYFSTSIPDVYAIGDCAEFAASPGANRKEIEQVWYTGRMHGETLAYSLTVKRVPYRPGVWFNSAKFFDIEYQTYGTVPNREVDGISTFYWEHANGKVCFRAVYQTESKVFIGANSLGSRLRHEFIDKSIREKWTIDEVMGRLHEADFNPEFYEKFYRSILREYKNIVV